MHRGIKEARTPAEMAWPLVVSALLAAYGAPHPDTLRSHLDAIQSELNVAEYKLDPARSVDDIVWTWDDPTVENNIDAILRHSYAIYALLDQQKAAAYATHDYGEDAWVYDRDDQERVYMDHPLYDWDDGTFYQEEAARGTSAHEVE